MGEPTAAEIIGQVLATHDVVVSDTVEARLAAELAADGPLEALAAERGMVVLPARLVADIEPGKLRHVATSLDLAYRWLLDLLDRDQVEMTVDGAPLPDEQRRTLIDMFEGTDEQDDLRSWAERLEPFHPHTGPDDDADGGTTGV